MTSNSNSNTAPDLRAPPTRGTSSTATSSGLRNLSGAPPPPRRAAANADATATASASGSGSSGRTPVAHRTRHIMKYQAQPPTGSISVAATTRPPPRRTMAPPPPPTRSAVDTKNNNNGGGEDDDVMLPPLDNSKQFNNTATTALQRQADDGIAKRRAELRRLQQSRGAKSNATSTAAARSRLGGVGNFVTSTTVSGRQTMIPPPVAVAVAAAAQQSKNNSLSTSMGGTSTPVICSSPRLPSTATITRRLDYDACVDDHNSKSNHTVDPAAISSSTSFASSIPPPSLQQQPPPPPPPQSQPTKVVMGGIGTGMNTMEDDHDDSNSAGHWKRTSEIFNVGKQHHQQKQQQKQKDQTASGSGSLATGMNLNLFSPSGPDRTNPTTTANYRPPLGVIPMQSGSTKDKYAQVLSLITEPLTFQHEQQQQQLQHSVPPTTHHQEQEKSKNMLLPSIIRKTSPMKIVEKEKSIVVQQQDSSSGKSTPVMSNVDHHDYDDSLLPKAMKVGAVDIDVNERNTKSVIDEAYHDNNNDDDHHNDVDVSRLMVILERNEQEKKVALEKLTRMKMLLRLQHEQKTNKTEFNSNPSNDIKKSSGASVLLDEFKEMVATHGESAAGVWIAQQLENTISDRLSSSRPSSAGGGTILRRDDNNMLLSSIIPPLTPRSRSGSRAASPERGGGLGGLIDNHDDVLGGMGGSSRAKRMTTPLPKHFHKTTVGVSSGGSRSEGDSGGDGKRAGRDSSQNNLVHESVENEYLVKAAMSIPNEYGTLLASYLVRRPYVYGMPEHYKRRDTSRDEMWSSYTHLIPNEEYQQSATALEPTSIDIVAYIEADGSVFTLTGRCNARHGKVSSATPGGRIFEGERNWEEDATLDWIVFDDVEGKDRALGKVTYIDAEGNEKDYWLDSIYEEALTTRESYCMSMLSTAYALKEMTGGGSSMMSSAREQNHQHRQATALHANESTLSPPLNDSAENRSYSQHQPESLTQPCQPVDQGDHGTQALQQPAAVVNANQTAEPEISKARQPTLLEHHRNDIESERPIMPTSDVKLSLREPTSTVPPTKDVKQAKQAKLPPEEIYEPADSALPFLVVSILSVLFSMVWFFVKIPFRIGSVIVSVWLWVVALRVLWLLLADDNGAWEMGAGVDFEYNMPGIY